MTYFELMAAMNARAPVMARIKSPSYETVIVGTVAGVGHRIDSSGKVWNQVELKERGKNSITVVSFDNVEPLWEEK